MLCSWVGRSVLSVLRKAVGRSVLRKAFSWWLIMILCEIKRFVRTRILERRYMGKARIEGRIN